MLNQKKHLRVLFCFKDGGKRMVSSQKLNQGQIFWGFYNFKNALGATDGANPLSWPPAWLKR